ARVETKAGLERAYEELGMVSRRMEAAKEEERRRIDHELHDELGQTVTARKTTLERAAGSGKPGQTNGDEKKWIADMVALADHTIGVVRELSHTLRPPLLGELR